MEFKQILEKYRQFSFSERDKGDRFERLMQAYLLTDPQYATILKHVWMWNEFPSRKDFGGKDIGIDLVAQTFEGDYWAIQCKCFQDDAVIDKKAVDSFLATSSKQFQDVENLNRVGFSYRLWISTTNHWGSTAEETIRNQNPPVFRLNQNQLELAPVDWEKIEQGLHGEQARLEKKKLRQHQKTALDLTHEHFQGNDRGKLIMACGTGKTFTSLKIAEHETGGNGFILFLVPSISLLGQTLREWSADADDDISPIAICSDPKITKKRTSNDDSDSVSVIDLALPASTDIDKIIHQFYALETTENSGLKVVFSTYQSIEVIAKAQKQYHSRFPQSKLGMFDLIVCDEAHRTTGVALTKEDSSAFIKVHDSDFIRAQKRLYMTATPRLFSDDSKSKAAQKDAILCSMDDEDVYGEEIYRIGFGEAVEKDLLSDYKVLILTLSEDDVPESIQQMVTNDEHEIDADDASKLIGCINALSKQVLGDEGIIKTTDPNPMQRAVAFCQNIKISKHITNTFNQTADIYLDSLSSEKQKQMVSIDSKHIDGAMSAPERDSLLGWLKSDTDNNECKILTNVRCLSEGVDVPSLDAVLFLSARNSQVDVVQSVGRVMRRAPGKKYGYIIIPILVPSDIEPSEALNDNKRYQVVWSVLNALRAHDDRFNATINKIDLNKKKPKQIIVGGVGGDRDDDETDSKGNRYGDIAHQFSLQFEELQSVVYAKMVQKVGDRRYWEQWAKNVAEIAERQIERITRLIEKDGEHQKVFEDFLNGLRNNINPSVSKQQAIEMLSQHIITKPVFESLFENYSFVQHNPISISMQNMISLLEEQAIEKDTKTLEKFYDSVRKRAEGIDNAEGKQRIIIELYDKFFKTAFPKMVEQLGIVYTPVEVVDFIINSVNDVLQKEFGRSLSDENVNIIDPFTGTGTFIVRLLQSGIIKPEDLVRKYKHELFANEIVLLAYYIAAVNIENAFHDQLEMDEYHSFDGICLTDTFQLGESGNGDSFSSMFPENTERVTRQKNTPIKVIIGNPPYSVGQKSANDNAQNQSYSILDNRISETYAESSSATSSKATYDTYIKAFRWSSDRLEKDGGIICFVSNGSWIDGNSQDGFRKSLEDEFSSIYVFNLRGNARTSGEARRKEKGNVFGEGSRTPISITLLVKNENRRKASIFYKDIGDYLSKEEKLKKIKDAHSILNKEMKLEKISPNNKGDWINLRNDKFTELLPLQPEKKFNLSTQSFFNTFALGIVTARDAWVYNFSKNRLVESTKKTILFFNKESDRFKKLKEDSPNAKVLDVIEKDSKSISWSRTLRTNIERGKTYTFDSSNITIGSHRPFTKENLYFTKDLVNDMAVMPDIFPMKEGIDSLAISVSGIGSNKGFSCLMTRNVPDFQFLFNSQCFPLYYYEIRERDNLNLFDSSNEEVIKRDGISDFIQNHCTTLYGKRVKKEDIFFYIYGLLHSEDYRSEFSNDLAKSLPRIPLVESPSVFWEFSKIGHELAELHLGYESVEAYPDVIVTGDESEFYQVQKMSFPKKEQKDTIIYNSKITISNIPEKAYEYIVNGKSAIEWIMERYQVTVDKKSGIKNDPNDWAEEVGNPRYILDLLLSIINVSVQTVDIVNSLPEIKFD